MTERLYLIVDTYAKSREYPEHQYWPDQSRSVLEKKHVLADSVRIGRIVLSVSQKQS